ncbi:trifunctional serine/threonine-protein kinase/ATP-binding protein/sensor histidine kinase [Leptothoe kymatousa]|uniref:histidine kinase n=1 Tax=Leptothoe kymatousa TAU-MAC 1615 TaxID=2364775 RepID=A0ABS5Y432_9CYAN|nr:ATP-binding sensor histidine kinase [Leptothoe kymatousa]MBT9312609.1 AAA family ATPase [Leptothoe kymatousa TAU-MAC 1615]
MNTAVKSFLSHQLTDYTVTEMIYQGTRTTVYRAVETATQQPVVIKVLTQQYPKFSELVQFRNQYTVAKNLPLSGIVRPIGLESIGNGYALVMEDRGGVDLGQFVKQKTLKLSEILSIATQLANILHELHQHRVIHKDIKPANILIYPESKQVKLIDFSISSLLPKETQAIQNPKSLEGTLAYMAPEQTGRMNRVIDYRTDFYSLGVTLYQLLTGQLPFPTADPLELIHCHMVKLPAPVDQVAPEVPPMVGTIVAKLMAKNAENRYQSSLGLKSDLQQCLGQWRSHGKITAFKLGQRDECDRFMIPEKLYGREQEVQTLLDAFERVAQGNSELMLVAGFSGIGKTVVVNEVHKPITRQKGYFIKGKFDQFNRNIPFSAFVQAFRTLVGQLLGESDAALTQWKTDILNAVGDNGQVILEVIPELKNIIGEQSALSELSASAALNRFKLVFGKFVQVFTTKEHPLVIFLDDLQWADLASLNLLNQLMVEAEFDPQTGYLLVLGAYRNNEVFAAHPLMLTVENISQHIPVSTLDLAPLAQPDIVQLVADTLRCPINLTDPLAQLIYKKTQGNPFFTTQCLQELHAENCINFDSDAGSWNYNLAQVEQRVATDDVVVFMMGRLRTLPSETQGVLTLAACMGNQINLETLAMVCEKSPHDVAEQLWIALREGFLIPESGHYKFFYENRTLNKIAPDITSKTIQHNKAQPTIIYRFAHDRIQQAAYLLLSDEARITTHVTIGQLLLANTPTEDLDAVICEVVSHLNVGIKQLSTERDIRALIQLNLQAADKMLEVTGYSTALDCIRAALELLQKLGNDIWSVDYNLALTLYEKAAESAYLSAEFELMESCIQTVLDHVRTPLETVGIYKTKIQAQTASRQPLLAVETAIQILQALGANITLQPSPSDVEALLAKTQTALAGRTIKDLLKLPHNQTSDQLAMIEILGAVHSAAFFAAPQLIPIEICTRMNICLAYGSAPESAHTYADYGLLLCAVLNDIETGYQFGELALAITEQFPKSGLQARAKVVHYMTVAHWKEALRDFLNPLEQAYQETLDSGDLEFAAYGAFFLCATSFLAGLNLDDLRSLIPPYCQAIANIHQESQLGWSRIYSQVVAKLTIGDPQPWILTDSSFDESEVSSRYQAASEGIGLFVLYSNKMVLAYLFEELSLASEYADIARQHAPSATAMVMQPLFFFYDSLVQLEQCVDLTSLDSNRDSSREHTDLLLQRIAENQEKLKLWGQHSPANYQHKYELVKARTYAYLHQYADAIDWYDRAIAGAKAEDYIQEEAVANELAAKLYLGWKKEKVAAVYMQEAYYCYARWGAKVKVADLEIRYPELLEPILQPPAAAGDMLTTLMTIAAPEDSVHPGTRHSSKNTSLNEALDFASILKASQALSGTIQLDELLSQLTQIILQNSGGNSCALVLPTEQGEWQVQATASSEQTRLQTVPLANNPNLPVNLIQYVKNTQKTLVINDLKTDLPVIDDYLRKHRPKSILCLPLLNQGHLIGILYLNNHLTSGAFTKDRILVLNFLCSQAAISLENARLYQQSQHYAKRLEQSQLQLVQQEKMATLGNLVAGVAHEVNNPIGFLNGSVENAKDYIQDLFDHLDTYQSQQPPNEAVQASAEEVDLDFLLEDFPKLLNSMQTAADRITDISTSLRTFSRADTTQKVSVNIHEGLDSTLLILKYRLKANEHRPAIEVLKHYGDDLSEINCFPAQLNQVFMNILANAIDMFDEMANHMTFEDLEKTPQTITINTVELAEYVEIRISDNGTGMTDEVQSRIFDHLFTTKEIGKGTGLGLAIAHQIIVETHGGSLDVQSELGQGTEFQIRIPLEDPPSPL